MINKDDITINEFGRFLYKGILITRITRELIEDLKSQVPDYMDEVYNIILKEYSENISVIRDKKIDDILK